MLELEPRSRGPLRALGAATILASLLLAGCDSTRPAPVRVHERLLEGKVAAPRKIVLLAPEIEMGEISAGGVPEAVEAWSREARANVLASLTERAGSRFDPIAAPTLTDDETKTLRRHAALYATVAVAGWNATERAAKDPKGPWGRKLEHFDATVGPGLRFLKAKTGADAALFVHGSSYVGSKGRSSMAALGLLLGTSVVTGTSSLTFGVVDLETGDLLWLERVGEAGFVGDSSANLRERKDVDEQVDALLAHYPGVEEYAKWVASKRK